MKNTIKYVGVLVLVIGMSVAFGQAPPPPNGGNGTPSGGNTPVGGGAAIGGGLLIFLAAAAAYGGLKTWNESKYSILEEIDLLKTIRSSLYRFCRIIYRFQRKFHEYLYFKKWAILFHEKNKFQIITKK